MDQIAVIPNKYDGFFYVITSFLLTIISSFKAFYIKNILKMLLKNNKAT